MRKWRPELAVILLTVVLGAFAGGYFAGRSTVASDEAVVLTQKPAPSQAEALTPPADDPAPAPASRGESGETPGPVDLNTADAETLAKLPGIGQTLAGRIVAYRKENGDFTDPSELTEVEGIGEKKLAEIEPLVICGGY